MKDLQLEQSLSVLNVLDELFLANMVCFCLQQYEGQQLQSDNACVTQQSSNRHNEHWELVSFNFGVCFMLPVYFLSLFYFWEGKVCVLRQRLR